MVWVNLFISIFLPWSAGYFLILFLFRDRPLPILPSIAFAYGLGMGILTQWMLVLGVCGIKYNLVSIGIPLATFTLVSSLFFLRNKHKSVTPKINSTPKTEKLDFVSICLLLYIAYYVYYVFWRALNVPTHNWDAIATIAFKAKVFFYERSLAQLQNLPHSSYPLHVPFVQTWIALNLGEWNDQLIKVIFPFTFLSYLITHYYFLKVYTNRRWALAGVALVISSNLFTFHATIGYQDFSMLYYNCTTIMLLILWNTKRHNAFLVLASLFAGFATFVKLEGTGYLILLLLIVIFDLAKINFYSLKQKGYVFLKFVLPSGTICLFYHICKFFLIYQFSTKNCNMRYDFDWTHLAINITWDMVNRIPIIIGEFIKNFYLTGNWHFIWLLLVISLVNFRKCKSSSEIRTLLISLLIFLLANFSLFLFTQHYVWIAKSDCLLSRSLLHFFPLSTLLIILLNFPGKRKNKEIIS